MESRLAQFVRGLYFEIQTIEGVQPLEIWIGIRETFDSYEMTALVKNLYKIVDPARERALLWNTVFARHARVAHRAVNALIAWFSEDPETRIFARFPYPPTGDADQKELYRFVKARASTIVAEVDKAEVMPLRAVAAPLAPGTFPDSFFDFREMRIVDNELPIHHLYRQGVSRHPWPCHRLPLAHRSRRDLHGDPSRTSVEAALIEEYRRLARRVHNENPLTIHGRSMNATELLTHIHEKLKYEDYLDLFENVYSWFEQARAKLAV